MSEVEIVRLLEGEEEEALDFFYSTFVRDEGQLASVGAASNEMVMQDVLDCLRCNVLCCQGCNVHPSHCKNIAPVREVQIHLCRGVTSIIK